MSWKESEVFPEGKDSILQYVMPGGITLEDYRRALSETRCEILREFKEDLRRLDQRLAGLEHDARQPRLVMEANGPANTKTRERKEGAATAVPAMHGDSCSADRVDPNPICSTSFGDDCTGPPAPPCSREDVLVDNGTAAPKSCLPSLEMRSPTAAGGLLPTGEDSLATGTNRMFDPGGSQGHHACPFLGLWRALLCGRFMLVLDEAAAFLRGLVTGG